MDPLSLTSGIIAVGQVVIKIIKCTDFMYRVSKMASTKLAREVKFFATTVDAFGFIISTVHSTISEHYRKNEAQGTLQRVREFSILEALAAQAEDLIERVEDVRPRVKPGGKGIPFFARFKWLLQIDSRREIEFWMHRVQFNFQMIMNQVSYEALQERLIKGPQSEIRCLKSNIKQLRRIIKNNIHSVKSLKDEQEHFGRRGFWQSDEHHHVELAFYNAENVIIKTGNTIVYDKKSRGNFTAHVPSSSRFDRGNINHEFRHLDRPSRQRSPSVQERRTHQQETPRSTQSITEAPTTQDALQFPKGTADTEPHAAVPTTDVTTDYTSVYVSNDLIRLDPNNDSGVIAGYIDNNSKSFTARINPNFPKCIIARRTAVDLGLQVVPFSDTEDPVEVVFEGSHRELINEKAIIRWKKAIGDGDLGLRPLRITCLVAESPPQNLTFGNQFLQRRRHYWKE
ncbi:hypothetical protein BJ875DRAFT_547014, partial [Amylocarpus encephaloides]